MKVDISQFNIDQSVDSDQNVSLYFLLGKHAV